MKRASLTIAPVAHKTDAPDLTDRLLSREVEAGSQPGARPTHVRQGGSVGHRSETHAYTRSDTAARPKAKSPAPKPRAPQPSPQPKRKRRPPPAPAVQRGPALPVPEKSVSPSQAMGHSREAVAALIAAARSAPARYDLGLRYRLDALAHHLEQVAEFVEAATREVGDRP